jgi:hypothetical protein
MHHSEYTTITKLILRASKKVNDRHTVATFRMMQPSREAWTLRAIMIDTLSHRRGDRVSNRDQRTPERCAARARDEWKTIQSPICRDRVDLGQTPDTAVQIWKPCGGPFTMLHG